MRKQCKYKDYGEYLEDACDEQALRLMYEQKKEYILDGIKLKITEKEGRLTAEWERL
jgi:hypothetical protein